MAPEAGVDEKSLPRNAVWFSRRLKEVCKDLRAYGWQVSEERGDDWRITITRAQGPRNTVDGVVSVGEGPLGSANDQINHVDTGGCNGGLVPDGKDGNDSIFPAPEHGGIGVPSVEEEL